MNSITDNISFQLGLLQLAFALTPIDGGQQDSHVEFLLRSIQEEEEIPQSLLVNFMERIKVKSASELYRSGVACLEQCSEEDRLRALVHLYRLAETGDRIRLQEVWLMLHSLKHTQICFEEVVLSARMANSLNPFYSSAQKQVA